MDTITLQGPVIIVAKEEYQSLLDRLMHLENKVNQLTQYIENLEDIKIMHEAEAEYFAGDTANFADLLIEAQTETP
jgi:hypothetical protein